MDETRPVKIQVRGLSKVFGKQPKKALELRDQGLKRRVGLARRGRDPAVLAAPRLGATGPRRCGGGRVGLGRAGRLAAVVPAGSASASAAGSVRAPLATGRRGVGRRRGGATGRA